MPILSISRARTPAVVAIVLAVGPARARAQQPVMPAFTAGKGAFIGVSVTDLDARPFPGTAEQRANAIIRDAEGNYIKLFGAR
jgi:hypothetical protein